MKIHSDKYILLTGGAGFIGSALLHHLNHIGMKNIVVVDQLGQDEKWKNLVGKAFLDFVDKDDLFCWLQGREEDIEAIIHLGACSSTTETDCDYLMENNYRYSCELAEFALTNDIRFIYASSAATYGDGSQGFSDDLDLLETLRPLNMYGYSKHLFDLWLKNQNVLDHVTGLKFFNVFGPNEYHKGSMASAILKMVPDVLKTGKIKLFKSSDPKSFADGEQVRDFIYVKDVARMTAHFLTNDVTGIFNLGSGLANTWKALAEGVFKGLGKKADIEFIDMPEVLIGKYQNYTKADMTKWESAKLPKPTYSLEEAVIDYVQNYLVGHRYL